MCNEALGEISIVDLTHKSRRLYTAFGDEKFPCEICGKLVWGIRQHRRDAHGIKNGLKRRKARTTDSAIAAQQGKDGE